MNNGVRTREKEKEMNRQEIRRVENLISMRYIEMCLNNVDNDLHYLMFSRAIEYNAISN